MKTKLIQLTRLWDGHPAGEIIEEADFTVDSMVRKGYGNVISARPAPRGRKPKVEVADAVQAAQTADVTPQTSERDGD